MRPQKVTRSAHRPRISQIVVCLLSLSLLPQIPRLELGLGPGIEFVQRAQAHEVKISQDVGATLHIEPDDTPRAGEETLAWFALTRKGGETIPLSACDCQLSIYSVPKGDTALLSPDLAPIDAEGYEDIPGAEFTFPSVGAYTLAISGSPKQADDFTPFDLNFDVTVAAGKPAPAQPPADSVESSSETVSSLSVDSPTADTRRSNQGLPKPVLLIAVSAMVLFGGVFLAVQHKQQS